MEFNGASTTGVHVVMMLVFVFIRDVQLVVLHCLVIMPIIFEVIPEQISVRNQKRCIGLVWRIN